MGPWWCAFREAVNWLRRVDCPLAPVVWLAHAIADERLDGIDSIEEPLLVGGLVGVLAWPLFVEIGAIHGMQVGPSAPLDDALDVLAGDVVALGDDVPRDVLGVALVDVDDSSVSEAITCWVNGVD